MERVVVYTFIAKGLKKVADPNLDSGEKIKLIPKTLEELIDIILSQSKTPPIIVIQSDHGSSLFSRSDPDYERNRLKNFSAFYLPEIKDKN